jgi:hypothetical protein
MPRPAKVHVLSCLAAVLLAGLLGCGKHALKSASGPANDRDGLEHLCRYLTRPPIANDRLQELPDGRPALRFKQAWRDGTTHIVFTPHELIGKLIPLIPRPRCHLVKGPAQPGGDIGGHLDP